MIGLRTVASTLIERGLLEFTCDDAEVTIDSGDEWTDVTGSATNDAVIQSWSPSQYDTIYDQYTATVLVPDGYTNSGQTIQCTVNLPANRITPVSGMKAYGGIYSGVATTTRNETGNTSFFVFTNSNLVPGDIHTDIQVGDTLHYYTGNTPTTSGPPLDVYGNSLMRLADSLDENGVPIRPREIRTVTHVESTTSNWGGKSYNITIDRAFDADIEQYRSLIIFPRENRIVRS